MIIAGAQYYCYSGGNSRCCRSNDTSNAITSGHDCRCVTLGTLNAANPVDVGVVINGNNFNVSSVSKKGIADDVTTALVAVDLVTLVIVTTVLAKDTDVQTLVVQIHGIWTSLDPTRMSCSSKPGNCSHTMIEEPRLPSCLTTGSFRLACLDCLSESPRLRTLTQYCTVDRIH